MDQFLTLLGNNLIFSVPLVIVVVFALLEVILMMTGFSVLEPINGLFDGADGIDAPGAELLAWANKGGVPSTIFYGILLMSFGACGLFLWICGASVVHQRSYRCSFVFYRFDLD